MKKCLLILLLSMYSLTQTGIDQIDEEFAETSAAQKMSPPENRKFLYEQILKDFRRAYEKKYSEMNLDELKKELDELGEKLLKMDPAEFKKSMLIQSEVLSNEIRKKAPPKTPYSRFQVFLEYE